MYVNLIIRMYPKYTFEYTELSMENLHIQNYVYSIVVAHNNMELCTYVYAYTYQLNPMKCYFQQSDLELH